MNVLEKTGLEIKREVEMNELEILSHHLEKKTEIKKIQHHHVMILQLVPVVLRLETKTGTSKSCRIYTILDKEFLIGWNQTEW